MKWKQFFTPITTMDADETRQFIRDNALADFTILDVRQPKPVERRGGSLMR